MIGDDRPPITIEDVREAIDNCGIGGIYDNFHDPVDAIRQMATYIKEMEKRVEELELICPPKSIVSF